MALNRHHEHGISSLPIFFLAKGSKDVFRIHPYLCYITLLHLSILLCMRMILLSPVVMRMLLIFTCLLEAFQTVFP